VEIGNLNVKEECCKRLEKLRIEVLGKLGLEETYFRNECRRYLFRSLINKIVVPKRARTGAYP
jgi:hypothetical protein